MKAARRAFVVVAGIAIGLAVAHRVLVEPGVVGLFHDWNLPAVATQNIAAARAVFEGWTADGLGHPVGYPTQYPLLFVIGILSWLGVSAGALSKCVLVAVPATAFVCGVAFGRAAGLRFWPSLACGALYALNPVMLNKLVSGQLAYLFGYAFVPAALAVYIAACRRGAVVTGGLLTGALLALAGLEIQLGLIAAAGVVLCAVAGRAAPAGRRAKTLGVALATFAVIELPTAVGVLSNYGALASRAEFHPLDLAWFSANSLDFSDALRLTGYLTGYDALAIARVAWWSPAAWIVVAGALCGLFCAPKRLGVVAESVLLLTLFVVVGVHSPLGALVAWAFLHVPLMQAFRELYHLMVIPALIYALGIGFAFAWRGARGTPTALLVAAKVALALALAVYAAPLLSGDAEGQIAARPYDAQLAEPYRALQSSANRIAWFPFDEPLAFGGRGAGIDPMAQTAPGSLWDYSLEWPLTAVAMDARADRWGEATDGMRALSVGTAVDRASFRSVLYVYEAGGAPYHYYLRRRLSMPELSRDATRFSPAVTAYGIAGLPLLYGADAAAVVPQRLAVAGALAGRDVAPFAFGTGLPQGVPYVVVRDPRDVVDEATAGRGMDLPLAPITTDAGGGFVNVSGWWWYQPAFADVRSGVLAVGPQMLDVPALHTLRDGAIVLSYLASPLGGRVRLQVDYKGWRREIDTSAPAPEWRSAAFAVGSLDGGAMIHVMALDPGAVVVRAVRAGERADIDAARAAYDRLLHGARAVVDWEPRGLPFEGGRSGVDAKLGTLRSDREYRIRFAYDTAAPDAEAFVVGPAGFAVACVRLRAGAGTAEVAFPGIRAPLRLALQDANLVRWSARQRPLPSLLGVRAAIARATGAGVEAGALRGTAGVLSAPHAITVLNSSYDERWTASGTGARHLPTSLGTNAWLEPTAKPGVAVRDVQTPLFEWSFSLGTAALLAGLIAFPLGRALPRAPARARDARAQPQRTALRARWAALRARAALRAKAIGRAGTRNFTAVTLVGGAVLGVLAIHRVALAPGVLGLERDWAVPATGAQIVAFARQVFDGLQADGLGLPVVYPANYPLVFFEALVAACGVPAGAISKLLVALGPALGFVTATVLARALGMNRAASSCGGFVYALGPAMLNKIVAGQPTFVLGLALAPLPLAVFLRACRGKNVLWGGVALGATLALAGIQIQLAFLLALAVAFAAMVFDVAPIADRARILGVGLVTFAIAELPVCIGLLANMGALSAARQGFRTDFAWTAANSVRLDDALKLAGYPTHYEMNAVAAWPGVWSASAYVVAIVAAAGLFVAAPRVRAFGLAVAAICIVIAMGVYSPLSPLILWSYRHVAATQAFVELYDVLTIVALVLSVGVAAYWSSRFGRTRPARVNVIAALAMLAYAVPLLTGDAGGQLHAYPFDRPLSTAYARVEHAVGRTVWFPMDQPLAYDGEGHGVDPMWTTAPGSLWQLSLHWPLTVVDMDAHAHDWEALRADLASLGVQYAVRRPHFRSILYRFLLGGGRHSYLEPPLAMPPLAPATFAAADDMGIDELTPLRGIAYGADGLAIVPGRLAAATPFLRTGFVPVAYGTAVPPGIPYVVVRDPGDAADEMLAAGGLAALPVRPAAVFPYGGFSSLQAGWWFRPDYADFAGSGLFAIGRAQLRQPLQPACRRCLLEVAWIASPVGGRFQASLDGNTWTPAVDTNEGETAWRSALFDVGTGRAGAALRLRSLDAYGSVAIRTVRLVDASDVAAAAGAYGRLVGGARAAVSLQRTGAPYVAERAGDGPYVGAVDPAREYLLRLRYATRRTSRIVVEDGFGNLLSTKAVPAGSGVATLPFSGVDGVAGLAGPLAPHALWRLESRPRPARATLPPAIAKLTAPPAAGVWSGTRASVPAGRRVVGLDAVYGALWATSDATAGHLETLTGTNVWIRPAARERIDVWDPQTPYFRAAYIVGMLLILTGVVALLTGRAGAGARA